MGMGFREERLEKLRARRAAEAAARAQRNDALLADENFAAWLGEVADMCDYLGGMGDWTPYRTGYLSALKDLVSQFVFDSTRGAAWLGAYAAEKAAQRQEREVRQCTD